LIWVLITDGRPAAADINIEAKALARFAGRGTSHKMIYHPSKSDFNEEEVKGTEKRYLMFSLKGF
jgi:hypothetical protein